MGLREAFTPHWLGVTWSLAAEEQFYLIVPLMIWCLPRRLFVTCAILLVFAAPCLRSFTSDIRSQMWTPWRGDSLLLGAILSVVVRHDACVVLIKRNVSLLYAGLAGLVAGAVAMTFRPSTFGNLVYTWLACMYAVILLIAVSDRGAWVSGLLRNQVLVWFGIMSYGLYMYHQVIAGLMHGAFGEGVPSLATAKGVLLTAVSFVLTLIITAASFYLFEQRFVRFGHTFRYQVAKS